MSLIARLLEQLGSRPPAGRGGAYPAASPAPASLRSPRRAYPSSAEELRRDKLMRRDWYYGLELLDGVGMQGMFPLELPMLPRLLMRNCNLADAECLDLGTMEGLMPVLMRRGGASRVVATDASTHCLEKIDAVKHYHGVDFDFRTVGLMYDMQKKFPDEGFDLINCSGLLYHVVSPMHVLLGVRPLLKRNGLMIVSTNVVLS